MSVTYGRAFSVVTPRVATGRYPPPGRTGGLRDLATFGLKVIGSGQRSIPIIEKLHGVSDQ
jgi:hypothetical protein